MRSEYKYLRRKLITLYFFCLVTFISCKKILDVAPSSQITFEQAFEDDLTASATIRGIYSEMLLYPHPFGGGNSSVHAIGGLSADELIETLNTESFKQFEGNSLRTNNTLLLTGWNKIYNTIYSVNAALTGLEQSTGVTENTKGMFRGEMLFVRAFSHFYLVNLFGKVPIVTTSDYKINATVKRADTSKVYEQIINDLLEAKQLLSIDYFNGERVRPTKAAAAALLARVYLYTKQWTKAEMAADELIGDARFALASVADITASNNAESIWQLHSSQLAENGPTEEGIYFFNAAYYNALRPEFLNAFEAGDNRKTEWIHEVSGFLTPNKYKVSGSGGPRSEYSTVFRLAEQYLIRAEARIQLDNIEGGIEDLNVIRTRARGTNPGDLPGLSVSLSKSDALLAVEQERRVELFTEWGHRWFDLKRWGRADAVLGPIKGTNWQSTDILYPLPQQELDRNKNLGSQNDGY